VEFAIDATSLDTLDADRDEHLRSAAFLDVERFPIIHFKSTKISHGRPGGLRVTGDLTIRDIARRVVINVDGPTPPMGEKSGDVRFGLAAYLRIRRRDFGLTWNELLENGGVLFGETVDINIDAQFIRTASDVWRPVLMNVGRQAPEPSDETHYGRRRV
jgi:polyisoprenoid-binding protein YceI